MKPLDHQAMESEGLTNKAKSALFATRPWMILFAVLGFIYTGFFILLSLGMIVAEGEILGGVVVLLIALFIGYVFLLLSRSAGNIKRMREGSSVAFEAMLKDYKTYWMIWGVIMIIILGFMVIAIISTLFLDSTIF